MIPLQNPSTNHPDHPLQINPQPKALSDDLPKVSAVVVTLNNSRNIRRTLSRLSWCAEIIVVDGFSKDGTAAICREFNCTVHLKAFEGYYRQRQYGISKTTYNWILSVDAEEILSEALIGEINRQLSIPSGLRGYHVPTSLVFFNKQFLYGRESWRYQLRLFDKRFAKSTDSAINKKTGITGPTGKLRQKMLDHRFRNIQDWEDACRFYGGLPTGRDQLVDRKSLAIGATLSLPLNFLRYYLLHLNFLNGVEGFYWSALNAYQHFCRSLRGLERNEN